MTESFRDRDLRDSRFTNCDLSGAVLRGVELAGVELDSPWLFEGDRPLLVNGVDVLPYVEAELDARFPGRALRLAADPPGLREAYAAVEEAWAVTRARAEGMPAGTLEESVDGEWSFTQTLRHLVMATDVWLGRAILGREQPYHPFGLAYAEAEDDGLDMSVFSTITPTYAEVLEARASRQAMVRDHLATVTAEELEVPRANPWAPQHSKSTRSCLHTILEEEWEHHRYAVRDLDAIANRGGAPLLEN